MKLIKKSVLIFVLFFAVICIVSAITYAEIPHLINYQGKLTTSQGQAITGTKKVTFRIYNTESGGSALWEETYNSLSIDKGIFNVMLGGVTPLNLAFDQQYYLGIQVESDPEMVPRQRLASAGYAFNSARLDGKAVTEFSLANHTHDASNINAGILPVARGGTGVANKTMTVIQYTGNGQDNRLLPHGLGVAPTVAMVIPATSGPGVRVRTSQMALNESKLLETSYNYTDGIKSMDTANITLGSSNAVNGNGTNYTMICMVTQ